MEDMEKNEDQEKEEQGVFLTKEEIEKIEVEKSGEEAGLPEEAAETPAVDVQETPQEQVQESSGPPMIPPPPQPEIFETIREDMPVSGFESTEEPQAEEPPVIEQPGSLEPQAEQLPEAEPSPEPPVEEPSVSQTPGISEETEPVFELKAQEEVTGQAGAMPQEEADVPEFNEPVFGGVEPVAGEQAQAPVFEESQDDNVVKVEDTLERLISAPTIEVGVDDIMPKEGEEGAAAEEVSYIDLDKEVEQVVEWGKPLAIGEVKNFSSGGEEEVVAPPMEEKAGSKKKIIIIAGAVIAVLVIIVVIWLIKR